MLINHPIAKQIIKRKTAFIVVMLASSFAAFATLGDGKGKPRPKSLLTKPPVIMHAGTFTLKSHYDFRGNHIISEGKSQFLFLNTTVTYQKGNTTYIVPIKRKVVMDKLTFNPAARGHY